MNHEISKRFDLPFNYYKKIRELQQQEKDAKDKDSHVFKEFGPIEYRRGQQKKKVSFC